MSNAPGMTASEREYAQKADARRKSAAAHWRTALRREFPEVRMSVRADRDYITASWTGGPSKAQAMGVFHALEEEHQHGIPRTLRTRTAHEMGDYQRRSEELKALYRKQEHAERVADEAIDEVLTAGKAGAGEAERAAREERMNRAHDELERLAQEIEETEAILAAM